MLNKLKYCAIVFVMLLSGYNLYGQCNSDVSICTQGVAGPFTFDQNTPGPPTDYADPVGCSTGSFGNDFGFGFILLQITTSGPLNLLVDGNATTGFIDVIVYDIPGGVDPCVAVQDQSNEIGCNYATSAGGCTQFGNDFPCGSSVPAPNVVAGQTIMVIVHDYSTASTTFTLDLGATGAQTGPPDATITPIGGTICNTDPPFQMNAVDLGGTWTGTGISPGGMFDPASAGLGNITIDYSIGTAPCIDADQTTLTVIDCNNPCYFNNMTANIGACEPDNTFTVTGDFVYTNNPGSGTIIVEATNASGTYTQTFNPPFTDGATTNFSISGIPSDGSPLDITVYFSDDVTCTQTINSTSPEDCSCSADIGTFTVVTDGDQVGNNITLCYGDNLTISTNGDWVAPAEATNPPGPVYDPGVAWLVYSCPPSVALTPSATENVPDDPCLITIASNFDLNETNDQFWMNALPPGTFTNNTVYFVPITMYSIQDGIYSYVNTTMPCYELGPVYAVQYVPQITETSVEDCTAGTVTTTVSGGTPAIDGSNFTGTNLTPATASFVTGTTGNNGNIVVGNLVDGDVYSFDIEDANGCPITITGTFTGLEDASFSYPQNEYCADDPNPSPTITGDAGGQFSSAPAGLSLNAFTGQVNIAASTAGTYTITYQSPDPICYATETFVLTINPLPTVGANNETICLGDGVILMGTGADTYTWTNSVTDGVEFFPNSTTTYTVTGTVTATGCTNTGTATVTVDPVDDASFTTTDFCEGTPGTTPNVTGTGGGTFAFNPAPGDGATINPVTGVISNGVGGTTYSIEYTTNGACPQSSIETVTVNGLPVVVADDVSICVGASTDITASGATTYDWDNGLGAGQTHNVTPGTTTVYVVTGTDGNGCQNTDPMTVTVLANAPIDAGPDVTICDGSQTVLTASGGATYSWDNGLGAGASHTVSPSTTTTYIVNGQDVNGCTGTDQVVVTVDPVPAPVITGPSTYCTGTSATLSTTIPYTTYSWSTGATTPTVDVTQGDSPITVTVTITPNCPATSLAFVVTENNVITTNSTIEICQGESATIHGNTETVAGTYSQTFMMPSGCDSISNIDLIVHSLPVVDAGLDQEMCDGIMATMSASAPGNMSMDWDNGIDDGVEFYQPPGSVMYTVTCTDNVTGCESEDSAMVTVNALPIVDAGPDQTMCTGSDVTLAGSGAVTYIWTNSVIDNESFTQGVGTIEYEMTGIDANNCQSTDLVTVTVYPNPVVSAGNDITVCDGDDVILTGSGAQTYVWDNNVYNGTAFVPTVTDTYTVTGTDANGCVDTDDVLVTVEPIPVVSFMGDTLSGCSPLTVNFTNTTPGTLVDCIWTIGGEVLSGCGTVSYTFDNPGSYDVGLTTSTPNGCSASDTYIGYVNVEGYPTASFTASSYEVSNLNTEINFNNTSVGADDYHWNFGDGSVDNSTVSPTHVFPDDQNGTYDVQLIAYSPMHDCPDTARATIEVVEELIFFVPNTFTPDGDDFNETFQPVFTSGFDPYDFTLLLFNRWGEVIFESHNADIGWNGRYGGEMVQDGTYTWKIIFKTNSSDERKVATGHVNVLR